MSDDPLDPELLVMLACPETHQSVQPASAEVLAALNARIDAGELQNRGGDKVDEVISAGLVREDGRFFYPVRDGIPILLKDEAIAL